MSGSRRAGPQPGTEPNFGGYPRFHRPGVAVGVPESGSSVYLGQPEEADEFDHVDDFQTGYNGERHGRRT